MRILIKSFCIILPPFVLRSYDAVVTIQSNSSSSFIPLGSNVTFTCTDFQTGSFLRSFKVATEQDPVPFLTISDEVVGQLRERDIFTETRSNILTVLATVANNLTVVQCSDEGTEFSEPMQVLVIGIML